MDLLYDIFLYVTFILKISFYYNVFFGLAWCKTSECYIQCKLRRGRWVSQLEKTRPRDVSQLEKTRPRDVSQLEKTRPRDVSQLEKTRPRDVSQLEKTRPRDVSQSEKTRPRDVSQLEKSLRHYLKLYNNRMTSSIKTITLVLKVLTYVILSNSLLT
jgi:hypothetical protein